MCTMCVFLIYLYRGEVVVHVRENLSWLDPKLVPRVHATSSIKPWYPACIRHHQQESKHAYQVIHGLFKSEYILAALQEIIGHDWMVRVIMDYCCGILQFDALGRCHDANDVYRLNTAILRMMNGEWWYGYKLHKDWDRHHKHKGYKTQHFTIIFAFKLVDLLNH